jgi:hypothetical protein
MRRVAGFHWKRVTPLLALATPVKIEANKPLGPVDQSIVPVLGVAPE